jgi:hypothetical protein
MRRCEMEKKQIQLADCEMVARSQAERSWGTLLPLQS